MADTRRRIYYTKAQTNTGLVTKGKEWMFTDGTEYIGQYHSYTTGEVFTEPSYVSGKSKKLIPYIDYTGILKTTGDFELNRATNSEYDLVKNIDVKKSKYLNPNSESPTDKDVVKGFMIRYFVYKVNDGQLVELDKDGYGKVGTDDGFDAILWHKFKIRWKLSGSDYDIIDRVGNIKEAGIIDTNMRTVAVTSETYPSLMEYITDYREFVQN